MLRGKWFWGIFAAWLAVGCVNLPQSEIRVLRPAKLEIDPSLKKIFIDPALFDAKQDQLGLKEQTLQRLKQELEREGYFKVILGPVAGFDPNLESVGLLQGQIVSREEIQNGQTNRLVQCHQMFNAPNGSTRSLRGLTCHPDAYSQGTAVVAIATRGEYTPPMDMAIQVIPFQNVTRYLQVDLSLTRIGKVRETIAIRSEKVSYGQRINYEALHAYDNGMPGFLAKEMAERHINPLLNRQWAIAEKTHPKNFTIPYRLPEKPLSQTEGWELNEHLLQTAVTAQVAAISPHMERIKVLLPTENNAYRKMAYRGEWMELKNNLAPLDKRTHTQLFYLGLATEAMARSKAEYLQAREYYRQAMELNNEEPSYGQAQGRISKRLREDKRLQAQTNGVR